MGRSMFRFCTFSLPLLLSVIEASAQFGGVSSSSFSTIGGITYARLVCSVEGCYYLRPSPDPPERRDHSVWQTIYVRQADICGCDFGCPYYTQTATCPLGKLAPGDYTLNVDFTSWLGPEQWTFLFTVPEHNDTTLSCSREANSVRLDVNGVPNCFYTIESSSSLTNNWTEVTNHIGAPFTYRDTLQPTQTARFYRVRMHANVN